MMNLFFNWSIDNAILMLQLSFFFSVMSFIMCLILFYKRHKDEVSRRIPAHHAFDENSEFVGEATDEENSPVTKKPTSSPYFIIVKNTTNESKRCNLFGFGKNIFRKNFGSDEGVTVEMAQSNIDYLFMLIQSAFQPFETGLIQIRSKNLKQLMNIVTITSKDANGQSCHIPIITANYIRPDGIGTSVNVEGKDLSEDDEKFIDLYYTVKIDMSTDLDLLLLPNSELSLIVYPTNKFNPSMALSRFMGAVKEYSKPKINKN